MAENLGAKVAGFTVFGLVFLTACAWAGLYIHAGNRAPRNASVEGISIAGLSPRQAEQRLREGLADRAEAPITVTYGDGRSNSVDPAAAGLSVDLPASVERAGAGAGLGPRRIWEVVTGGGDHQAQISVDQSRMQPTLEDLDSGIGTKPVEGTVKFQDGRAVAVPGRAGLVVDRNATQRLLERRFLHGGSQKIPTVDRSPTVTRAAVKQALVEFGEPAMSGPVTLVLAGQTVVAPPRLFEKGLSMVAQEGVLVPRVDGELMLEALGPAMPTVGREPVDARIEARGARARVIPAKVGVEVDPQAIADGFAQVAVRQGAQRRLVVPGKSTQPGFTTAEAKALKVTERVSTFTTHFPYADYRNTNLTRAARMINGTLLRPGQTFSLNDIVGERTKANGFTEGYVVSDGVFTKDLGGGVSQIATTTFNAMFFAGLEKVEHKPPAVHVERNPVGREATVAWPSPDLKFTNSTPYAVLVNARVRKSTPSSQGAATVSMYSTKWRKITTSNGPRTNRTKPHVRYLRGAGCEAHQGTPGFSVNVFRYFRDLKSGKVLRKEKFHTDYIAGETVRCGRPPKPKRN